MEPGLHPSMPGLVGGATHHEVLRKLLLPCVMLCSGVDGHEEIQTGLKVEHVSPCLNQQHLDTGMAGKDSVSQYLVHNLQPLSSSLSVVAIITLFLTVLLPRERLHSLCTYLACTSIF